MHCKNTSLVTRLETKSSLQWLVTMSLAELLAELLTTRLTLTSNLLTNYYKYSKLSIFKNTSPVILSCHR